jgi:hypothetical protein
VYFLNASFPTCVLADFVPGENKGFFLPWKEAKFENFKNILRQEHSSCFCRHRVYTLRGVATQPRLDSCGEGKVAARRFSFRMIKSHFGVNAFEVWIFFALFRCNNWQFL